ncbi:MAG: fibronectin type III domain-containing protein [Planctomycetaceae bacterium]
MSRRTRGGSAGGRPRRRGSPLHAERLEPRLALCAGHFFADLVDPAAAGSSLASQSLPAGGQTFDASQSFAVGLASSTGSLATLGGETTAAAAAANGLPDLHSLPGAPTAIYLDFDGEGANAAYDVDGDPTTFNATEQATITEAWRQISVYFSMFAIDVTTVKPTVPFAWHVSSPDISGGYSYVGVFPNSSPQSFNNAGDARTRVSGIAHELGHNFGLSHQSDYDLLGNKTKEYSSGFDSLHGPIMGVDYAQSIHKWFIGHPSGSASSLQDDVAVIAGKIKARQTAGGDGFRTDDHGGTIATARALTPAADGSRSIAGIIERMADIDVFSFSTARAGVSVVSVVPTKPSALDAKLEIYDGTGVLVAASDGGTNEQQIVLPTGGGTWYAFVSSHGDYGDLGSYDLTVNDLPDGWRTADVGSVGNPGDAAYDASTGTFTVSGGGADVWSTADAFRFAYQTLTGNGSIVARVTQNQNTNAWSKVGVEIRESLAANAKHVAMVTSATSGPQLVYRTTTGGSSTGVNGTAAAFTPTWVRLVRSGSTITASRSADGVSWTTVGSATVSMASTVYIGLLTCSHDTAKINDAKFTNVSFTGTINAAEVVNALAAPAGVTATRGTGTALAVSWQPVTDATGYVIERSDDGVDFVDAGTAAAAATTWTNSGLSGSMRYFYRVRATDASGRSVASDVVSVVNRPSAVTSATVTSLTSSQVVLNWRDKSGDAGYRIERSSDNVTFTQIATVGTNVPSYTATGLTVGTQYWFRITPMTAWGDSVSTTITGSTRLPAVGGLAFTSKTASAIGIQWTALSSATGYRIERSTDGTTFTTLANVGAPEVTYSDTTVAPLGEYYYRVVATNATTEGTNPLAIFAAAPAATALPAPWTSADIGNVVGTGAAGLSSGTFTVVSNGADIWSTADAFRYTSQPLVGDGSITARVATLESTAGWAKIGVMIRESSAANAKHAMMVVSPSNSVAMQYRSTTGGSSTNIAGPTGKAAPYWVRMVRTGNVLTGSVSPDGTTWTQVGSVTISMASSVLVGLSANSNSTTLLNKSTFTNVTVSNNAPTVGTAAVASPATVTGQTTTVSVAGADDHAESNLTYEWSASGPAAVTFGAAGTNAAKSTTATFTKAGAYILTATITDTGGLTVTSAVNVTVAQTLTSIDVTPTTATIPASTTQQFAAVARDQFGAALATQPTLTWSATGGGTVSTGGLFTAPATAATTTVKAASGAVSRTATVSTIVTVTTPTVVTPAAASPATVAGTTASLSVLGADDGGEAALTYAWSSTGPAAVVFSASGTNAAKSTVATFSRAGTYALIATIRDGDGRTTTSTVVVAVSQTATAVTLTPGTATLPAGATQQFTATVTDQFGNALATQPACTWSVAGGGTVTTAGVFTAPSSAASSTVTAASGALSGTAAVATITEYLVTVPAGQTVIDAGGRAGLLALRKRGAGTLVLAGPNAFTGGVIVEEGAVIVRDPAATGGGRIDVRMAGRLTLDVGSASVPATALSLLAGGLIDVGSGGLAVAAGGIGDYQLRQMLLAGRADGGWNGSTGIVSARAAASEGTRAVGCRADQAGVTIAFAAAGDIDVDGVVDVVDMSAVMADGGFNTGDVATWSLGDFNYDGVFDQLDISELIMADAFNVGFYRD